MIVDGSSVVLNMCTIYDNISKAAGSITVMNGGSFTCQYCMFNGNIAYESSVAMAINTLDRGGVFFYDTIFKNNRATTSGFSMIYSKISFENC